MVGLEAKWSVLVWFRFGYKYLWLVWFEGKTVGLVVCIGLDRQYSSRNQEEKKEKNYLKKQAWFLLFIKAKKSIRNERHKILLFLQFWYSR